MREDKCLRLRREFHRNTWQLHQEVPQAKILALLGKPDEVRRENPNDPCSVIWCYGVDKPGTLATLGTVRFAESGLGRFYDHTINDEHPLPPASIITEKELRHLLRIIDSYYLSTLAGEAYNPLPLTKTVNALQPYGKAKVLLAIEEYLWTHFDEHSIPALVIALFEVPSNPGYLPRLTLADSSNTIPPDVSDKQKVPYFPLVFIDDVPLSVAGTLFQFSGLSTKRESYPHLDWFKAYSKWRSKPLTPPDNPLQILNKFMTSPEYFAVYSPYAVKAPDGSLQVRPEIQNHARLNIQRQLLRLVSSAYPYNVSYDRTAYSPFRRSHGYTSFAEYQSKIDNNAKSPLEILPTAEWERIKSEYSKFPVYWDKKRQKYAAK